MNSWFYQSGDSRIGPISFEEMKQLAASGSITRATFVWTEGMPDWKPAAEVAGLFTTPPPFPGNAESSAHSPVTSGTPRVRPYIDNHLTKAIMVTLFCCLPLGIVSIVKAAQVNARVETGDIEGAERLARDADNWANWSLGIGLIVGFIYFIAVISTSA